MYEYFGSGDARNQKLEVPNDSAVLYDSTCLFICIDHLSDFIMIQYIIVGILFIVAAVHIGRKIYLNISGKDTPGCEKCAVNEINKSTH